VTEVNKTVHVLTATREGTLPLRFVTLIHVGTTQDAGRSHIRPIREEGSEGVVLSSTGGEQHTVCWEAVTTSGGRFVSWRGPGQQRFFAGDGNANPALDALLGKANVAPQWNGRVMTVPAGAPGVLLRTESVGPDDIEAFTYHGRPEMTPVGTAGRVAWELPSSAHHSVLYRLAGTRAWQRQLQPGRHRSAWILIPDLTPGAEYELQVVSELGSGRLARSPVFRRRAPPDWRMY